MVNFSTNKFSSFSNYQQNSAKPQNAKGQGQKAKFQAHPQDTVSFKAVYPKLEQYLGKNSSLYDHGKLLNISLELKEKCSPKDITDSANRLITELDRREDFIEKDTIKTVLETAFGIDIDKLKNKVG